MNTHCADVTGMRMSIPVATGRYEVELLDGCAVRRDGQQLELKPREQRLIAALGLQGHRRCGRGQLAGMLWPDVTEARASGSLRSTVWGLRRSAPRLLVHGAGQLGLSPEAQVDVDRLTERADRIVNQGGVPADGLTVLTTGELLPGWYEDWVLNERDRLQQLRLTALENLAELLIDTGAVGNALTAARAATDIDPLCESAQRVVIRIQLANGNYHAAVQRYLWFRRMALAELGIGPSVQMERLIRPVLDHSRRGRRAEDRAPAQAVSP